MNTAPLKHFIYGRKSTEEEDRQILSIDAQLSELQIISAHEHRAIVSILTENKSAKEPGREIFNDMLRRIEKGEANAILTWKLDRLARNFEDGGRIIGLLQRGVIQEIRTFDRSYLPSDNVLMIAVEFGMANQYVRDLSANILRGIREKLRRGVFCGNAPLGYVNNPKLRTIEPHPVNFKKMKRILQRFATGTCSLTAIQREMAAARLFGDRSGKPPALTSIDHLLRNPFFYGVFSYKGELHQGSHVPMISKKTFDEIQEALVAVGRPRKASIREGFIFRHFATCGSCGLSITVERHIKKSGLHFHYYRCTHKDKKKRCEDRSFVREERFHAEVKRNTELATIPHEWKERFFARIETWQAEAVQKAQVQAGKIRSDLTLLKARIDRLNTAFADGGLDIQEFKELKNPLVTRKVELEQNLALIETTRTDRLEPLRNWVLEANQAGKSASDNNWLEMKSFLQKAGSNRLLRAQTLTVSFKKPWNFLAETNIAMRSVSDASAQSSKWWSRGGSNP